MYRTKCPMYDEVSLGNPGTVPYCTERDKLEPDCQHCTRPDTTNADRIRAMTDEELADEMENWIAALYAIEWSQEQILDWLKEEVKDGN